MWPAPSCRRSYKAFWQRALMLQTVLHLSDWLYNLSLQLRVSMRMMMCGTDESDEGAVVDVCLVCISV